MLTTARCDACGVVDPVPACVAALGASYLCRVCGDPGRAIPAHVTAVATATIRAPESISADPPFFRRHR